jgi:hypothetical protein
MQEQASLISDEDFAAYVVDLFADVPPNTLNSWHSRGILKGIGVRGGAGRPTAYSLIDVLVITTIKELARGGVALVEAGKAAKLCAPAYERLAVDKRGEFEPSLIQIRSGGDAEAEFELVEDADSLSEVVRERLRRGVAVQIISLRSIFLRIMGYVQKYLAHPDTQKEIRRRVQEEG